MKCEYGLCLVCEKEIAKPCGECGVKKPTNDYTEVELTWSNGSKMATAVCTECAPERVWKADKDEMTKAVWAAWDKLKHPYSKEIVLV